MQQELWHPRALGGLGRAQEEASDVGLCLSGNIALENYIRCALGAATEDRKSKGYT